MSPTKIVLATFVTLFGSAAMASANLVGWDDDVEINPKSLLKPSAAPKAPARATPAPGAAVRARSPQPAQPSVAPAAPTPAPPTRAIKPVAPEAAQKPATKPMSATSQATAPKPSSTAWRTKFQCSKGFADHSDDAADLIENSLGFEDIYGKQLVSPDRLSSFQLAQTPQHQLLVQLKVNYNGTPITFIAPAYVCEKRPGVLQAVIKSAQRHDCLPVFQCNFIDKQYTVDIEKPASSKQAVNSVKVSGTGLDAGVYTGVAR